MKSWKHFQHHWPFVQGIHRSPVNSSHKGQWRRALMFSLICAWINDWVNNSKAGDLRCHRAHYDVIVMVKGIQLYPWDSPHKGPVMQNLWIYFYVVTSSWTRHVITVKFNIIPIYNSTISIIWQLNAPVYLAADPRTVNGLVYPTGLIGLRNGFNPTSLIGLISQTWVSSNIWDCVWDWCWYTRMMPRHRNTFCNTGPLWGDSTGDWWIPLTKGQWCRTLVFSLLLAWTNLN